jgi:hypothetical protein
MRQRRPWSFEFRTECEYGEDSVVCALADKLFKELQARRVNPVQVLDHEQDRPLARAGKQPLPQRTKGLLTLASGREAGLVCDSLARSCRFDPSASPKRFTGSPSKTAESRARTTARRFRYRSTALRWRFCSSQRCLVDQHRATARALSRLARKATRRETSLLRLVGDIWSPASG